MPTDLARFQWKKGPGDALVCVVPPAVFTLKLSPKGDGRWTWEVFTGETTRRVATGITASRGAAKTIAENFVNRSGLV